MPPNFQIRATFTRERIIVYQAYPQRIAEPALQAGKFVEPFSFNRMTWIKPSFLWLMSRSNWATRSNQEHILAVHIKRSGWEWALAHSVLTSPEKAAYASGHEWAEAFEE